LKEINIKQCRGNIPPKEGMGQHRCQRFNNNNNNNELKDFTYYDAK
jgi:hypothetical protein